MHSFEIPVHDPLGTQEAVGGSANIVQHVWPDGHVPAAPPPPRPERRPHVAMRPGVPPPSVVGLITVLPSGSAPLAGPPPEDEEPHAAASPRPRKARAPKENRANAMRVSPGVDSAHVWSVGVCFSPRGVGGKPERDHPPRYFPSMHQLSSAARFVAGASPDQRSPLRRTRRSVPCSPPHPKVPSPAASRPEMAETARPSDSSTLPSAATRRSSQGRPSPLAPGHEHAVDTRDARDEAIGRRRLARRRAQTIRAFHRR